MQFDHKKIHFKKCGIFSPLLLLPVLCVLSFSPIKRPCRPVPRKDTVPSLLGSLTLSSSSPSPAFYSEAKTASTGSLLNGPLSYSQSSDILKVRSRGHRARSASAIPFFQCLHVQKDIDVIEKQGVVGLLNNGLTVVGKKNIFTPPLRFLQRF